MKPIDPLQLIRTELRQLNAYSVADASGMIKLDAMENPYSWPGELLAEWQQCLSTLELNRYPVSSCEELKQQLFEVFGPLQTDLDMLFGNGSDELIQLLVMAIAKAEASVLTVTPSFSMYRMICTYVGVPCHEVPLTAEFELDLQAMQHAVLEYKPSLLFLAYPNNPTGNLWDPQAIKALVENASGLVVIDEAYAPFSANSLAHLAADHEHVLILKTASKLGLAGIRFGWLTGQRKILAELDKIRLPYNINSLTQTSMRFALEHYDRLAQQARTLCAQRAQLIQDMRSLPGITVYESQANFVLFRAPSGMADRVNEQLKADQILIKNLSSQPYLRDCLRVTVGTAEENAQFLRSLQTVLPIAG